MQAVCAAASTLQRLRCITARGLPTSRFGHRHEGQALQAAAKSAHVCRRRRRRLRSCVDCRAACCRVPVMRRLCRQTVGALWLPHRPPDAGGSRWCAAVADRRTVAVSAAASASAVRLQGDGVWVKQQSCGRQSSAQGSRAAQPAAVLLHAHACPEPSRRCWVQELGMELGMSRRLACPREVQVCWS